ncbi:MAG: acylphosphatase [Desulforhopalus sp.]|nr:acylphosphatase [Desulforhopalus sp.]
MQTTHVIVEGLVQGVCFRDYTCRQAFILQLTGWVRNLPDGSVEAMLRGPSNKVAAMLQWLRQGSPYARVDRLQVTEVDGDEVFTTFEIRY